MVKASCMSSRISDIVGRMVIDSRGNPTVEVECWVEGIMAGRAIVPSGASTGVHEALELRDGDQSRWVGKGVDIAVGNVNGPIYESILGMDVTNQAAIDATMCEADGTDNK